MERKRLAHRSAFEQAALAASAFVASLSVLGAVLLLFASVPEAGEAKLASAASAASASAASAVGARVIRVARRS